MAISDDARRTLNPLNPGAESFSLPPHDVANAPRRSVSPSSCVLFSSWLFAWTSRRFNRVGRYVIRRRVIAPPCIAVRRSSHHCSSRWALNFGLEKHEPPASAWPSTRVCVRAGKGRHRKCRRQHPDLHSVSVFFFSN